MRARWNLLVYAIAGEKKDHDEVLEAIHDMRAALSSDQLHIAVQLMAKKRTTRYWISTEDRTRSEVLDEAVDASRQAPLTSFINAASKTAAATSTALVLWAHGTGLDHVHDYPSGPGGGLGGSAGSGVARSMAGARPVARFAVSPVRCDAGVLGPGRSPERLPEPSLWRSPQQRPEQAIDEPDRPASYGCRWGPDPNTGRYLTNVTMKKAIAASRLRCVDLLGLNACWMASLEVEYELRRVAEVAVASQVYATPWPYYAIVKQLSRSPAQSAEQLAGRIVASVKSGIAQRHRHDAVSAFRSGPAMEALATAFDSYAEHVVPLIDDDWPAVYRAVIEKAQRLDDPHQVDLMSLIRVLGRRNGKAKAAADLVARRFQSMRIANAAHSSHPGVHGLSVFCPRSTEVDLVDAYKGTEFRTNSWASFLRKFQHALLRRGEPGTDN